MQFGAVWSRWWTRGVCGGELNSVWGLKYISVSGRRGIVEGDAHTLTLFLPEEGTTDAFPGTATEHCPEFCPEFGKKLVCGAKFAICGVGCPLTAFVRFSELTRTRLVSGLSSQLLQHRRFRIILYKKLKKVQCKNIFQLWNLKSEKSF